MECVIAEIITNVKGSGSIQRLARLLVKMFPG